MRHDYNLPAAWPDMDPEERHVWMSQERTRRQAERQRTAWAARVEKQQERMTRRLDAQPATIDVTVHR